MSIKYFTTTVLAVCVICISGCVDYGRIRTHKVAFLTSTTTSLVAEDERLRKFIRDALSGKGFEEMPGTPYIWSKRGVSIQVYRDSANDLILKIRAFGSKRDVRASEKTEQELLSILNDHIELKLTPITPPKPLTN